MGSLKAHLLCLVSSGSVSSFSHLVPCLFSTAGLPDVAHDSVSTWLHASVICCHGFQSVAGLLDKTHDSVSTFLHA